MNNDLIIDYYFQQISCIPRGSTQEKEICDYVENFAKEHHLAYTRDQMHNIVIYKKATAGYEDHETVMLEAHMDMVCEKNNDSIHDFDNDPIQLIEKDGMLWANQTTLGADDGVGVCYMLAILADDSLKHPALECVFTVQEEIGLNGAMALKSDYFQAKKMIGLDSGQEDVITVCCSGGRRVMIQKELSYHINDLPSYQMTVKGLQGGHSGSNIDKERGNANKIMARLYYHLLLNDVDVLLASFQGGLKDNAIPRECISTFASSCDEDHIREIIEKASQDIAFELVEGDPAFTLTFERIQDEQQTLSLTESQDIISMMYLIPNGFQHKSLKMDLTMVSLNMGVVKMNDETLDIHISIRSPMESAKDELSHQLILIAHLFQAQYILDNNYPGWAYEEHSPFRKQYCDYVLKTEGKTLIEEGTHGGLETGIIKGLLPDLDIITLGPDMFDIHTPQEHLDIASYHRCYQRLIGFLETL